MEEEARGEVKLLGAWPSLFSFRVIWALKLKGIGFNYTRAVPCYSTTPCTRRSPCSSMVGKPIAESAVILEYIEEAWPEKNHHPLLPREPMERAEARFWTKFVEDKIPISFRYLKSVGEDQERATEEAKHVLKVVEDYAELRLGKEENKFFGGERIGLMDLAIGWMWWLRAMEEAIGIKLLAETAEGVEEDRYPNLSRWWMNNFREDPVIKD